MIIGLDPGTSQSAVKPCVRCGLSERYENGACAPCARSRTKIKRDPARAKLTNAAWKLENPEKWKSYQRKSREKHREKINASSREKGRTPEGRMKSRLYQRIYRGRKAYGSSAEELQAMRLSQNNCCAICGVVLEAANFDTHATVKSRTAVIDHADTPLGPVVRGILCSRCNMGIGQFDDDPEKMRAAADYLEKNKSC